MRIRKTPTNQRNTYTYYFSDNTKSILRANENGVTNAHIKLLHSFDDQEVYSNIKNNRMLSKAYKNTSEGNKSLWSVSLENILYEKSNNPIKKELISILDKRSSYSSRNWDELYSIIEELTPRQKEILDLVIFQGYTLTQIAKKQNTSPSNIKQILNRAFKYIRENYTM